MKKSILLYIFSIFTLALSAQDLDLNGTWQLSYWQQPIDPVTSPKEMKKMDVHTIPAVVPGNVELDLMKAGLLADIHVGRNNYLTRQWEGTQWCYTKTFKFGHTEAGKKYVLSFGGIDCIADIWLNGQHIGHTDNMLIAYQFDVTKYLKNGKNTVQVIIQSATMYGRKDMLGMISIGTWSNPESVNIRKAPHMFGWDILPRIVSAGLWRDVALKTIDPVSIRDVQWTTVSVDTVNHRASLSAYVQLNLPAEQSDHTKVIFTLSRNGKEIHHSTRTGFYHAMRQSFTLDNVDFWWPRGYGEPSLYDAKCEVIDENGNILATDTKKIGIRTIKLDFNEVDLPEDPARFCFIVNGERIFVRGTNWVPLDALHSRDTQWVDETVDMVAEMNCNMIRCWGGNVYESDHFYELCDKYGIMVWQDFSMACGIYSQGDNFAKAIEKEVTQVVCRLRSHPSLALWSGNNENDQVIQSCLSPFGVDPNKDRVSREVIPHVLLEYDPTRPYLPSSPYYGKEAFERGLMDTKHIPENHLWGPRGYYKDNFYTGAKCVFVSEIGYHGAPNIESLQKMMTPECVYPWDKGTLDWNEEWLTKSIRIFEGEGKTMARNNLMINQQKLLFGEVSTKLEDFIYASQIVQAEAMKYFIEMMRGSKFSPRTGIIWWNIRDGWPVISDAVVDYYMSKKKAYYYIRNVQYDVCCLINDAHEGKHPLVAVNDTRQPVQGEVKVQDIESGSTLYEGSFYVPANAKTDVAMLSERPEEQGIYLITYKVNGKVYHNHYLYGKAPFRLDDYKRWSASIPSY